MEKHWKSASVGWIAILLGGLVIFGAACYVWSERPSSTNDIYLIPAGYEGHIRVTYNVPGAPALQKEGKYDVIPVGKDGKYSTSTPDMEYGLVTDQYYEVDADGRRTPIDAGCIHVGGTGSSQIGSAMTRHTDLDITRTRCGEEFRLWGK